VLILPPGHAKAINARRTLPMREKWVVGVMLCAVGAVIVATVIALGLGGHSAGRGCFTVYVPGPVGAAEVHRCGADARTMCLSVRTPGAFGGEARRVIAAECRKLRLPVGP
jgi:hypothetical protein